VDSKKIGDKIYPEGYEPQETPESIDNNVRNQLLDFILHSGSSGPSKPLLPSEDIDTDLFAVMAKRRSTRKFSDKPVETTKIDKIIAAADTAPTAGNFQGFEI
jgi:hypothetical protein